MQQYLNITGYLQHENFDVNNNRVLIRDTLKQIRPCILKDFADVQMPELFDSLTKNRNPLLCIDNWKNISLMTTQS